MYRSPACLPHLLAPTAYCTAEQYALEQERLLMPSWHAVGTINELSNKGDFITRELFGHSVQIRNFDGVIRAFSNICAHRHCLLTHERCGNSPDMKCQYHGWAYGPEGKAHRIPQARHFAPLPSEGRQLDTYRVDTCGQIVFVCLSKTAPDLAAFLGNYHAILSERFGNHMREFLRNDLEYPANWKVPVENSLESYHVPAVHPVTFKADPGEARSTHLMEKHATAFGCQLPFSFDSRADKAFQQAENSVMKLLGVRPEGKYWQHHVFPNLLFSFTDAISLVQCVIPTGPTTSVAVIRQFGQMGNSRHGPRHWFALMWGQMKAAITKRILSEDLRLMPDIQAGLEKSRQPGVLGRCEERIHAFQAYVSATTAAGAGQNAADHNRAATQEGNES